MFITHTVSTERSHNRCSHNFYQAPTLRVPLADHCPDGSSDARSRAGLGLLPRQDGANRLPKCTRPANQNPRLTKKAQIRAGALRGRHTGVYDQGQSLRGRQSPQKLEQVRCYSWKN